MGDQTQAHPTQTAAVPMFCSVFKTIKREGMYLYVERKEEPFADLPQALLQQFGEPEHVLDLVLKAGRVLAQTTADEVRASIHSQGFYLQMPPAETETLS